MNYIDAKSLLSNYTDNNWWFGTNYGMNIYKGCCHGCIYCDSRSECYNINDFDSIRAKKDSINKLRIELKKKRKTGVIGTGAMSDPYNPFEKELMLTRQSLEEINKAGYGVSIITKSPLIQRDIDIITKIKEHSPVIVKITVTTYDDNLCRKIEPNVAVSSERFRALRSLSDKDIFVGILLMPLLPFINDTEENVINIVRKTAECGGRFIFAWGFGVTLRDRQREYFYQRLGALFPKEALIGKYKDAYGSSYECPSPNIKSLYKVFKMECEKYGLIYKMEDIINTYKKDYYNSQISLF